MFENLTTINQQYPELENIPLPSKQQIENFFSLFKRKNGNNNNISDIITYIKNHEFDDSIDDDEMFFFGLKYDENNEPIVRDRKNLVSKEKLKSMFNDIDELHYCNRESEFHGLYKKISNKWKRNGLAGFAKYFEDEWVNVECCPTARAVEFCWNTERVRLPSVTVQGSNVRVHAYFAQDMPTFDTYERGGVGQRAEADNAGTFS
ncbi:hypothetical protein BpHYR1_011403 [Brachionus plicatilis]|uniref:Uncharacterized protein n=1 Tax=Brachionus plicatilis TaxID=10195 RepID=A0A3M7RPX1_BRAPC|nr:hypothetical protein BpHYR1_011403 [Brachionus plicatilis]